MIQKVQIATAKDVATMLRMTEKTVCALAAQGKLPGFKIGRFWRFDVTQILQLFVRKPPGPNRPCPTA